MTAVASYTLRICAQLTAGRTRRRRRKKSSSWRAPCCASPAPSSATITGRPRSTPTRYVCAGARPSGTSPSAPIHGSGSQAPWRTRYFVALLKKHSDYGRPIRNEISFTRREIGRLIGRKEWGGRDSEQLARALHEIHYTFIRTHFKKENGRHVEHSFNIFPEILIERREFASDPIEACTITLAEPIVRSLEEDHFTCLNFTLMQELGTIGQALYMRAFFHFANLYDGRNRSKLEFQKRYDDMCTEWLGGLAAVKHASKIKERLGPHLDQLIEHRFLSSYRITKAKSGGDAGFVIAFRPGAGFFRDYDRFYRNRSQGELQWDFATDQHAVAEPLRVAYLFVEKRTGRKVASQAYVSSKEVETAKRLLREISFEEMPAFFDYALAEAKRTKFDVQTLGGRSPVPRRLPLQAEAHGRP